MFKSKIADVLTNVKAFEGLEMADLKTIAHFCEKRGFREGEVLIEEGTKSAGLHILLSGQVKVVLPEKLQGRKEHRPSQVKLNVLNQGDCFGEYSLIEKTRASASVIGLLPGELIKIPEGAFQQIMADDRIGKRVYHNLLHILIKRLRKKEEELDLVLVAG